MSCLVTAVLEITECFSMIIMALLMSLTPLTLRTVSPFSICGARGRRGEILPGLAEKRVDRNRRFQREGRRNGPDRPHARVENVRRLKRGAVTMIDKHGNSFHCLDFASR